MAFPKAPALILGLCLAAQALQAAPLKKPLHRKARAVPTHTPSPVPTPAPVAPFDTFKRNNQRQGLSTVAVKPPLTLKWTFKGGRIYSSPAASGGTAYFGSEDGSLYAVALADGSLKWKCRLGERVYSSSPTVSDGRVFICSVDGCLDAVDAESGKVLWKNCVAVSSYERRTSSVPAAFSSPLVQAGLVYFGADNKKFYAVDVETGKERWHAGLGGKVHDNSAAFDDGKVFLGTHDGSLYALDAGNGDQAWKTRPGQMINTCPAVWEGLVFFGSGEKSLMAMKRSPGYMHAVKKESGEEAWKFKAGLGIMSSPALDGQGAMVFGSADKKVYCLDARSGREKWSFATGSYVISSPLISGRTVYVGSMDQKFYALDMETGKEAWHFDAAGGIFSSPTAVDRLVLVGSLEGYLYCFEGKE